jgi:hypothetical protein
MKHLLNNISEEEKNNIREQHTGGMKIAIDNFRRLVETKQGDVKPYMIKEVDAVEPVVSDIGRPTMLGFGFDEGSSTIKPNERNKAIDKLANNLRDSLGVIQQYHNDPKFKLPKFVNIHVGTSSTGSADANKRVAEARLNTLQDLVLAAFAKHKVRADVALKVITKSSNSSYTPSKVDATFYDTSKMAPDATERRGYIVIQPLKTAGNTSGQIDNIADALRIARGYNINPDEEGIAKAICRLETYSDITDLNRELRNNGGLERFINHSITNGLTSFGSDTEERRKIVACLNKASNNSRKGNVAKIVGGMISISF